MRTGRPKGDQPPKRLVSFRLPESLYVECKEASRMDRTPLTTVVEIALEKFLERCRKKWNEGQPFDVDEDAR